MYNHLNEDRLPRPPGSSEREPHPRLDFRQLFPSFEPNFRHNLPAETPKGGIPAPRKGPHKILLRSWIDTSWTLCLAWPQAFFAGEYAHVAYKKLSLGGGQRLWPSLIVHHILHPVHSSFDQFGSRSEQKATQKSIVDAGPPYTGITGLTDFLLSSVIYNPSVFR